MRDIDSYLAGIFDGEGCVSARPKGWRVITDEELVKRTSIATRISALKHIYADA